MVVGAENYPNQNISELSSNSPATTGWMRFESSQ